jgi:hypothetical protein
MAQILKSGNDVEQNENLENVTDRTVLSDSESNLPKTPQQWVTTVMQGQI